MLGLFSGFGVWRAALVLVPSWRDAECTEIRSRLQVSDFRVRIRGMVCGALVTSSVWVLDSRVEGLGSMGLREGDLVEDELSGFRV
jgi:hypothetical protein